MIWNNTWQFDHHYPQASTIIRINVVQISSIFRTKYDEYPEYHTSLDDFNLVTLKGCVGGFNVARKSIQILLERIYPQFKIMCEPQMSKKGLYPTSSRKSELVESYMNFLQ